MSLRKYILLIFLALFSLNTYAVRNPISFELNHTFQNPTYVGRTYSVIYTVTSQLPATMTKPLIIQKVATPASEFTYGDSCSNLKLAPGQSCNISINFTPVENGNKSVQLIMTGYDNNDTRFPALTTTSTGKNQLSDVYGNVTQSLPGTASVGQAYNYIFTFTNNSSSSITSVSTNVTQTSGTASFTTTCGSTLDAKKTCTISGTYTPNSASPAVQSVTGTLNYGSGKSASITTSTTITTPGASLVGSFVGFDYLPGVMVGGPTQRTIWALFTNAGATPVTVSTNTPPITATVGGGTVTLTPVFNHCSGAILNPGAACDMQSTVVASTVGSPTAVSITAATTYTGGVGSSADITTSTTVVPTIGTSRTVTLVNNCNFEVWFSLNGAQLKNSPTCPTPGQTTGCPTGTTCGTTNKCFWTNPAPAGSAGGSTLYSLPANTGTNTVTIPLTSADSAVQWSGNISASLGCNGTSSCTQADCENAGGSTSCTAGKGFSQPATEAEITMNISTSDSYDVEVINGFHIPIQMAPTPPFGTASNYVCTTPGNYTAANGFGSCDWSAAVTPGSSPTVGSGYYWVTGGGSACNINTPSCTDTTKICGLDSSLNQVCGSFLGYWTPNQVCSMASVPSAVKTYFGCDTKLSGLSSSVTFPSGSTLRDLMQCAVPTGDTNTTFNSCYLTYSGVPSNNQINCCGCIDWWTISGINANSTATSCTQSGQSSPQTDPVWNQYIQSGVQWLKKACPSAYTYPFDDKTSGFSCTNTLPGEANSVGYTITFCSGTSGLPTGKTEGRV